MTRYVVRRVLQMVPTLLTIVVATFALIQFIPGDPAATLAGEEADPATLARVRAECGLGDPVPEQFLRDAGRLVRGPGPVVQLRRAREEGDLGHPSRPPSS